MNMDMVSNISMIHRQKIIITMLKTEPTQPTEPTDPTEPTQPTQPTDQTQPTDPAGSAKPTGPDMPQTADNSHVVMWLLLLGASAFVVGITCRKRAYRSF